LGGVWFGESQFFDHVFAHGELLDSSCDGHPEFADAANVTKNLIVRDLAAAKSEDVLLGGAAAAL
jgi:hypothetical protein